MLQHLGSLNGFIRHFKHFDYRLNAKIEIPKFKLRLLVHRVDAGLRRGHFINHLRPLLIILYILLNLLVQHFFTDSRICVCDKSFNLLCLCVGVKIRRTGKRLRAHPCLADSRSYRIKRRFQSVSFCLCSFSCVISSRKTRQNFSPVVAVAGHLGKNLISLARLFCQSSFYCRQIDIVFGNVANRLIISPPSGLCIRACKRNLNLKPGIALRTHYNVLHVAGVNSFEKYRRKFLREIIHLAAFQTCRVNFVNKTRTAGQINTGL